MTIGRNVRRNVTRRETPEAYAASSSSAWICNAAAFTVRVPNASMRVPIAIAISQIEPYSGIQRWIDMPIIWNATAATMVGTAGDRNTIASTQRASRVRLRVTIQDTDALQVTARITAPAITSSVFLSGVPRWVSAKP